MKTLALAAFLALAGTPSWAQTDQQSPPAQSGGTVMGQGMPDQCRAAMQAMPSGCMEMMQGAMMQDPRGPESSTAQTSSAGMMRFHTMRHGMFGGRGGGHMRVLFALVDTDADGALTFEEISAVHRRVFNTVDANKDGKVTQEELQVFMQGW